MKSMPESANRAQMSMTKGLFTRLRSCLPLPQFAAFTKRLRPILAAPLAKWMCPEITRGIPRAFTTSSVNEIELKAAKAPAGRNILCRHQRSLWLGRGQSALLCLWESPRNEDCGLYLGVYAGRTGPKTSNHVSKDTSIEFIISSTI